MTTPHNGGRCSVKRPVFVLAIAVPLVLVIALAGYVVLVGNPLQQQEISGETSARPPGETTTSEKLRFDKQPVTEDPFADTNGPFYHSVRKAVSKDGLAFTDEDGTILEQASVPDVIRMPDGRIIIYAVDGGRRSNSGLMAAVSDDDGKTWQQGSLRVQSEKHFDGVDPDAVVLEDGRVRLFYVDFPDRKPKLDERGIPILGGEMIQIRSALSEDGIRFVEEKGVRYEVPGMMVTDPDVIKIGEKWVMYLSRGPENVALTSDDGRTFSVFKTIRPDGSVSNTVPIGEGVYRQYFCRNGISSATSTDGLNFADETGLRIDAKGRNEIICDPAPLKVGDGWLMFYKVGPLPQRRPQPGPGP